MGRKRRADHGKLQFPPLDLCWSCSLCSDCCRQHFVEVSAADMERIVSQGWHRRAEFAGRPLFVPYAGPPWRRTYRLAHKADGSCIFLGEHGLCRIHAEFGFEAKPIACQLYPYMLVPVAGRVHVGLRFSCPAVAAGSGEPIRRERAELWRMWRVIRSNAGAEKLPGPPPIRPGVQLDWDDTLQVVDSFLRLLRRPGDDWPARLVQAVDMAGLLNQVKFSAIRGSRLESLLAVLSAYSSEHADRLLWREAPDRRMLSLFRMTVAQYSRRDISPQLWSGWRGRLELFRAGLRFARGKGQVPPLQLDFGSPTFEAVEQFDVPLPPETWELLSRYFAVKLFALQFCGVACYRLPVIEGFYGLAITCPVILWLARWRACGQGRGRIEGQDLLEAIRVVDHNYAYNPVFGKFYSRWRLRMLAEMGELSKLIVRYAAPSRGKWAQVPAAS